MAGHFISKRLFILPIFVPTPFIIFLCIISFKIVLHLRFLEVGLSIKGIGNRLIVSEHGDHLLKISAINSLIKGQLPLELLNSILSFFRPLVKVDAWSVAIVGTLCINLVQFLR